MKPSKDQFSGEKIVHCSFGDVGIHYDAVTNFRAGQGRTSGTWSVMWSDNDVIHGGGGTVTGISRGCDECIVETFSGRVY